jgi:chromate transporter
VHRIGAHILVDRWLWITAIAAAAASLAGANFWVVLPTAGLVYALQSAGRNLGAVAVLAVAAGAVIALQTVSPTESAAVGTSVVATPTLLALFLAGLKGGLLTFGGAYTAIPFVRQDTVGRGWMTDAQFLDGLGLSGLIPAPLVIFVTFVGFVIGGLPGALVMTAGMFLPAFGFSLIFYERLEAFADNLRLQNFLQGVAAAVVGLIAVTIVDLTNAAAATSTNIGISAAIVGIGLVLLYRTKHKLAPLAVVLIGAGAGALLLR